MSKLTEDPRIDPRIKASPLGAVPDMPPLPDVASREELLAEANSEEAKAAREMMAPLFGTLFSEEIAATAGLRGETLSFTSSPDGNTVRINYIRPDTDETLPCVYYIHGGGMQTGSAFEPLTHAWGRTIAHEGVAVAMVDFRNCLVASSAPEVEPFPAGLNDCVSGLRWVIDNASALGIDPGRVIVAGESGGGNLTLATGLQLCRDGDTGLVRGLYAMCPCIVGTIPDERFPSTTENDGIILTAHGNRTLMAYGIKEWENGNPLAWPVFATETDVADFPPTVITVNECDPLRDEGIAFYRLLLAAGRPARCTQLMGTVHATEVFSIACPDISRDSAASIARFAHGH
ncbi:alpha/beta hydrolase [Streptomyces graminilatus]|uniref:alpha/beta hydrolase n=1 Tax=Streptomyces graminilatus TaxID=1464070 RepID=UPI0006E142A7|nr:alpha/beta hydrolase [Streptomyces graminilatus]